MPLRPRRLGMFRTKCPICGRGLSSYGSKQRGICAICDKKVEILRQKQLISSP